MKINVSQKTGKKAVGNLLSITESKREDPQWKKAKREVLKEVFGE